MTDESKCEELERKIKILEKDAEERYNVSRAFWQIVSFGVAVTMEFFVCIILILAYVGIGYAYPVLETSSPCWFLPAIGFILGIAQYALPLYIVWHLLYSTYHRFPDEINRGAEELRERVQRAFHAFIKPIPTKEE